MYLDGPLAGDDWDIEVNDYSLATFDSQDSWLKSALPKYFDDFSRPKIVV